MNKPKIFANFHNADAKGRVRLNCTGTMADIKRQKIVLQDRQSLTIYSEELEVTGVVQRELDNKYPFALNLFHREKSGVIVA